MAKNVAYTKGHTAAQHNFAVIPSVEIPRSRFNRSFGLKTTFYGDYLIPIFCDEALPGDTMNLRAASFVRMATPFFPIMDNIFLDYFFFAVPLRLIWDDFKKSFGEQEPGSFTAYPPPQMTENPAVGSLSDYIGIPTGASTNVTFNSFWHRAYNLIFNEWFRSEDLMTSAVVDKGPGPDTSTNYVLRRRTKRHDYFSSALPYPQKGANVTLPLGQSAPILTSAVGITGHASLGPFWHASGGADRTLNQTSGATTVAWNANATQSGGVLWGQTGLELTQASATAASMRADLTNATAATINQIREAFQIQRLLERDARGGSRYTEIVRAHFGVISPDARLQRPEYLGGGSTRVNVHPVARNNFAAGTTGADLSAFATASGERVGFVKSFTEHCVLLGLVNVRADITYQQGLERQFSRRSRYEFYWPSLSHLGEQAILNKEIFWGTAGTGVQQNDGVFGYQERYAEYRYKPSLCTGKMRSQGLGQFDLWHLGIEFATCPLLNTAFIESNTPFARILPTADTEPHFFGDFWFDYTCARPMPLYGVPGMIDHF